jgi:hypothetical protein
MARVHARARQAELGFEALSIEGGLLSPEWLAKVAQLQAGAQSEIDYGIPKGLALRDEIGRYWRIAQAHWADYRVGVGSRADRAAVAERFVIGLLKQAFGFDALVAVAPVVVNDRPFPIGYATLEGRVPVVVAPAGEGVDSLTPAYGDGTRRRSAFGLVQEYLNAQEGAQWGLCSDGATLRVLRDNASLTRPAWLEADLSRIFLEERYADFAALWLLIHQTRFGRGDQQASDCALEVWRTAGREEGTRARAHLRDGVEDALLALGQGFLSHPSNQALRAALQAGELSAKDYFNQLLRLVYRLIFLLAVEERGLLHSEETREAAKTLYASGYSLRRLRERSVKRSAHDRFSDLWEGTKVVFRGLAAGEPTLGLPALAGLFAPRHCPTLDGSSLENRALLLAIYRLAWLRENGSLARVNWRDMGPEELGSVYESLLELVPQVGEHARHFSFAQGAETKGNARKTTGSYYTPDSLVQLLLDSALEPVVAATVASHPEGAAEALLDLTIVDPACGSGHFLLAAARRLAAHVARLHADGTPSAGQYRHALRRVVGRCVFGVDLNPMAVELCKVGLWMEAVEPGLPLSFLDSHIQRGNALIGATRELLAAGIPDAAWEAIAGDDRKVANSLKKRNRSASDGQRSFDSLWVTEPGSARESLAKAVIDLDAAVDSTATELAHKEAQWRIILASPAYQHQKLVADAWCAAFVWPKQPGVLSEAACTNDVWLQLRDGKGNFAPHALHALEELVATHHFFHWHLQFPQVFADGGFDVVLGNPPWERVKLQEQEFFASRAPEVATAQNASDRKRLIEELAASAPSLWHEWMSASRKAHGESHFVRKSGRYPLSGAGDVNTYALFAEHNRSVLSVDGRAGFIVPTGIATDETTKEFFNSLLSRGELVSLYDFQSGGSLFGEVGHARFKFSLLTLSRQPTTCPDFVFFARSVEDLHDPARHISLSIEDVTAINPNSGTCPVFRSSEDARLTSVIHRRVPILSRHHDPCGNAWGFRASTRWLHMAENSSIFHNKAELERDGNRLEGNCFVGESSKFLPLYEAKMIHHFNHRYGDYRDKRAGSEGTSLPDVPLKNLQDQRYLPLPRYWVDSLEVEARLSETWPYEWLIAWRDICRATDERTLILTVLPRVGLGHTMPHLMVSEENARDALLLVANLSAFVVDFVARQKVGGTHLTVGILEQLPVLPPAAYARPTPWEPDTVLSKWITLRALELTYVTQDLEPLARDLGFSRPPYAWEPSRRETLRAELDATFFYMYGLDREEIEYVMSTFSIIQRKDERLFGDYRTKRLILGAFERLTSAVAPGNTVRD